MFDATLPYNDCGGRITAPAARRRMRGKSKRASERARGRTRTADANVKLGWHSV